MSLWLPFPKARPTSGPVLNNLSAGHCQWFGMSHDLKPISHSTLGAVTTGELNLSSVLLFGIVDKDVYGLAPPMCPVSLFIVST